MRMTATIVFLSVFYLPISAPGAPQPLSESEVLEWVRHTIPLPKEIEIIAQVEVPAENVAITYHGPEKALASQGMKELQECVGSQSPGIDADDADFTFSLYLGGAKSRPLSEYKNPWQAYEIAPQKTPHGLVVAALAEKGLYYACKTLKQLIRAKSREGKVTIPILNVIDWPDMEDRGLWGSDAYNHIPWLSDRKINVMEQIAYSHFNENNQPVPGMREVKMRMIEEGPTHGIDPIPAILHLEQLGGRGIFKIHPELQGKGDCAEGSICYSNPLFTNILAEWIVGYSRMVGVKEVDVWMAENLHGQSGCECSECKKVDRNLLEARVIVNAWQKARERAPEVGLRILTSEQTEDSNKQILSELPPGVKLWYYHSLLTYTSGESPMLRSYLAEFARKGRWIGVCPNLVAAVQFTQPFTGAQFIHYRMNEFVDKNMSGLIGYVTPRVYYGFFNVEAAAEWSWNSKGRTPHEFALSYAIREGISPPEKFAEWCDIHGPVAWDVYGSDWIAGEQRTGLGRTAVQLKEGKLPDLGFVLWDAYRKPWGDIKSVEQLNEDLLLAQKAVGLAKEMEIEELLQESLVVQGYLHAQKALWDLKQVLGPEGIAEENKSIAAVHFQSYIDGLRQARQALPKWERSIAMKPEEEHFVDRPLELIDRMIDEMKQTATDLGI